MDKYDKDLIIDEYISSLQHDYDQIKEMRQFVIIEDERYKELVDTALKIIDKKINHIINAKSFDDVKKHLKLKKLIKSRGKKRG